MRQLEITNKFDNALTGVAGDGGDDRARSSNGGQLPRHGQFWDLKTCEDPAYHDHAPTAISYPHNDDMIIANGLAALLPAARVPVYPSGPLCNTRGLTAARRARDRRDHRAAR